MTRVALDSNVLIYAEGWRQLGIDQKTHQATGSTG